ncbi:serpin family protein [Urbifossiella limnaea]|uniref:Serpin (Serine protease inhibitor) n=1 Tax=Urbifossiella limnaea TaxID=2528023 RepID=A0A517Y0G1_9BACT|nr:serpin family protein [Urbifossiella limnaea]QDU23242.1 Serpin (serine protease inhibitor) [Urbifossiella limnaea]
MRYGCLAVAVAAAVGCGQLGSTTATPKGGAAVRSGSGTGSADAAPAVPWTDALQAAADGEVAFALDLYARLTAAEKGNVFVSPYSIHAALALTATGAVGATRDQLAKALRLPPGDGGPAAAGDLGRYYARPRPDFTLAVANAVWGQAGYPWRPEWKALAAERFGGGFRDADFRARPAEERARINAWVSEQTRTRIPDLLQPPHVTDSTRMVLTNAVYFDGKWTDAFPKHATRPQPFTTPTGKVQAPLMTVEAHFRYAEGGGVQVVELPYRGGELSMLVILPASGEPKLTAEALKGWDATLSRELVRVTLPKFKHTLRAQPLPLLRDMGVVDALSPASADFGRMLAGKPEEPIFVANVVHQAFVDVTEEGTEAAAATAVVNNAPSPPPPRPKVFRADRPFAYLIRDTHKGTVLFAGRVVSP